MKAHDSVAHMSREIPPHVLYASPVPLTAPNGASNKGQTLPLSLIAQIVSFVSRMLDMSTSNPD